MSYPPLVNHYLQFCSLRRASERSGIADLSDIRFFCPTMTLPLVDLVKQNGFKYKPPTRSSVDYYFSMITNEESRASSQTFVPMHSSKRLNDADIGLIYSLLSKGSRLDDTQTFKYIIGELVANISEHSGCDDSSFIAQHYQKGGYMEAAFFDNGKTIGGSFRESNMYDRTLADTEYLKMALSGKSTKSEDEGRGSGLPSTTNILRAINSDVLIVSGTAAIYLNGTNKYLNVDVLYTLDDSLRLSGTLIGFQIHLPIKHVDIYEYIK